MDFARLLPRLVSAYDQGLLVPFLGAGMSMRHAPSWTALIAHLENAAGIGGGDASPDGHAAQPGALVRRANRVVRRLAQGAPDQLVETVRASLYANRIGVDDHDPVPAVPPQTWALAALRWPLAITSNYDDLFASAYAARRATTNERSGSPHVSRPEPYDNTIEVLGRSRRDCQRVLDALSVTAPTLLWAIHGFLPRTRIAQLHRLERELVIGHDEYRRIAHASMHYRRAFTEVWRRRSFLFLGSSLEDPYLLDLFSEVQEFHGANPQPHFALVAKSDGVDAQFLASRFNIIVVEYDAYKELPSLLDRLTAAVGGRRPRQTRWAWSYSGSATPAEQADAPSADLEIRQAPLPHALGAGEAVAVSAGYYDAPADAAYVYLSRSVVDDVRRLDARFVAAAAGGHLQVLHGSPPHAFELRDGNTVAPVLALRPWRDRWTRDVRFIPALADTAFGWAARHGFRHLRMTLIGAGRTRHFPVAVALAALVRAHAQWRDRNPDISLRLTIHVEDETAVFELTSGRLNVLELITAKDLRFWVAVDVPGVLGDVDDARTNREPAFFDENASIGAVARRFDVVGSDWRVRVDPTPTPDEPWQRMHDIEDKTLRDFGVLPGATLRFMPMTGDRIR